MSAANINQFHRITRADPDTVLLIGVGRGDDLESFKDRYPRARFIGVEPLREHLKALKPLWLWSTSDLLPFALGKDAGVRELHCNYEPDQRATFYPMLTPLPGEDIREVDTITLDQLHAETGPWGEHVLIWIDVEGAEAEIFKGIEDKNTLADVKWINTEVTFLTTRPGATLYDEIDIALQEREFFLFAIHTLSKNGRQADAIYIPMGVWNDRVLAVSEMQVKRKTERLAKRTRLVRRRRLESKRAAARSGS